jgi:hypothetical protein
MTKNNSLKYSILLYFLSGKSKHETNQRAVNDDKPTFQLEQGKNGLLCWNASGVTHYTKHQLNRHAMAFPSTAKLDSRYRRIQRFITEHSPSFDKVAWFIMGLLCF